jgi:small subunit ribosomal protein S17e
MGRVKSALIKRTTRKLIELSPETYTSKFEDNKRMLAGTMPSKRIRNIVAGYLTRIKKSQSKQIA